MWIFFPGGFCIAKAINNFPKGMLFLSTETLTLLLPSPCLKSVPFLHMSAARYNSWLTPPPINVYSTWMEQREN